MDYDQERVEGLLRGEDALGEVMFVLDSDREYEVHAGNVELHEDHIEAWGLNEETHDYERVFFGYDAIEHHKTHEAL